MFTCFPPPRCMLGRVSTPTQFILTCLPDLSVDVAVSSQYLGAVGHVELEDLQVLRSSLPELLSSWPVHVQDAGEHLRSHVAQQLGQAVSKPRVTTSGWKKEVSTQQQHQMFGSVELRAKQSGGTEDVLRLCVFAGFFYEQEFKN